MTRPLTTMYLVRHGESEANVLMHAGIPVPKLNDWDPDLTALGVQQAREKFEALRHVQFDLVFASDLLRAKKTAEIIAAERELVVMTNAILRETNRSSYYYNQPEQQSRMNELLETLSHEQKLDYREASMESYSQAATRLITFCREVAVANPGKTILIVAHGTIMRSFLVKLGFATLEQLPSSCIDNTGHVVFKTDGVDFFIIETHGIHKGD